MRLFAFFFVIVIEVKDSHQGFHEKRLLNGFFGLGTNYSVMERPVVNESMALPVFFGLTLQQIIDVDEKNQMLTSTIWISMEWNDYNLRWNSSEYGGLSDVRVHPDKIWKPDILLYNSADERFDNTFHSNVVLYSSGDCVYIPPGIFKSTCKINITWFPFDEQHCSLKFGSWSYDGNKIDLQLKKNDSDLEGFMVNGEWELMGVPAKRNVITYACCPEPYVDITFTIIIRRRVIFYVFNLVLPCAMISSITVLGFCLPVESGEKLTLGVTILLSLTVFLLLVAESMPPTSDAVPLIGTYFSLIMVMTGLSVVLTVVVLNVHFRTNQTHTMPSWVRKVLLEWLPRILFVDRPNPRLRTVRQLCSQCFGAGKKKFAKSPEKSTPGCCVNGLDLEARSCSLLANVLDLDDRPKSLANNINSLSEHDLSARVKCAKRQSMLRREGLQEVFREVKFVADRMRLEDADTLMANDWKFAATVLDRLFLWVIIGFTLGLTGGILMSAPHFQI